MELTGLPLLLTKKIYSQLNVKTRMSKATKGFHVDKRLTAVSLIGGYDCYPDQPLRVPDLEVEGGLRGRKTACFEGALTVIGGDATIEGNLTALQTTYLNNAFVTKLYAEELITSNLTAQNIMSDNLSANVATFGDLTVGNLTSECVVTDKIIGNSLAIAGNLGVGCIETVKIQANIATLDMCTTTPQLKDVQQITGPGDLVICNEGDLVLKPVGGNVILSSNIAIDFDMAKSVLSNVVAITGATNCPLTIGVDGSIVCTTPGQWGQLGQDIDGGAAGDISGWAVSLSSDGNTVAIGAPNVLSGRGRVRVYDLIGAVWTQRGLDIDGVGPGGDQNGVSVSISSDGNTVAIGAYLHNGNEGHTRIFDWTGVVWLQRGLDIDGENPGDRNGFSVSLSSDGNTVATGSFFNDGGGVGALAGHTRVFDWTGVVWLQRGSDIDGEAAGDLSGYSVSLSSDGNTVAIGAFSNDGNEGESGHTRVYAWTGAIWLQRGSDIDGEAAGDESGISVSLSADGDTVAIGANKNDGVNGADSGHVRVYDWTGVIWLQRGLDIDGEAASDNSGVCVSLSSDGSAVAIGANKNDGVNGADSGHVRVYDWTGAVWMQRGLDIDGEAASDNSGFFVSFSSDGNRLAIGAYGNDDNGANSGHTRVYEWMVCEDQGFKVLMSSLDMQQNDICDAGAITANTTEIATTATIGGKLTANTVCVLGDFDALGNATVEKLTARELCVLGDTLLGDVTFTGNVLGLPGWEGNAESDLDMAGYDIGNVTNLTSTLKTTLNDLCVTGNVSGLPFGWIDTAESDLDMADYDVGNIGNLTVLDKTTVFDLCINGTVTGIPGGWSNIAESDLDMVGYDIENVGNLTVLEKTTLNDLCITGNVVLSNLNGPVFVTGGAWTQRGQDLDGEAAGIVGPG